MKQRLSLSPYCCTVLAIFAFSLGFCMSDATGQVKDPRKKLQDIRSKIQEYRQKLQQEKQEELSSLDKLNQIDKEINLLHDFINQAKSQEIQLREKISDANSRILRLMDELQVQREVYADRLVHFYKHGRLSDFEILLSSRSLNQALIWLKYIRRIQRADRRRLQNLLYTKSEIEKVNEKRRKRLTELEGLVAEKNREENRFEKRRKKRQKILEGIRNNKKLFAQKIKEFEQAALEIKRLIRNSEAKRKRSRERFIPTTKFTELKGKMMWPTLGEIVNGFGKIKNPKLNTFYMNEGVDIKAKMGSEVQATCSGVITAITWQRGRGNIIIINHYGGYYTVYTHLSEIHVQIEQRVSAGQVIGRIGTSGSLSGPVLHFEIWKETTPINPEIWLKKIS